MHWHHEDTGVPFVLHGEQPMVCHEGGMRQRRARGHDLGAADIDTPVGLLVHVDAHVGTFVNWAVPVHWRMNDGMVEEEYLFLCLLIPYSRIGLVRRIKRCIGSQGAEKGPFV